MAEAYSQYKLFLVSSPAPWIIHVQVNRPQKLNAFYEAMWVELGAIFNQISTDPNVRAAILSGAGEKAFTAGLDVEKASETTIPKNDGKVDVARRAVVIRRHVQEFQDCITSIEICEKRMYLDFPHC